MDIKIPEVEVIAPGRPGHRRRFSAEENRRMLDEAAAPGSSISEVARRYSVAPSLLFRWRRLMDEGSLTSLDAGENVVPQSEVKPGATPAPCIDASALKLMSLPSEAVTLLSASAECDCEKGRRTSRGEGAQTPQIGTHAEVPGDRRPVQEDLLSGDDPSNRRRAHVQH